MLWVRQHAMLLLGAAVSLAYWPGLLEGASVPRWAAIAVGAALLADPRSLSKEVWLLLGVLLALCAVSLGRSPWLDAGVGDLVFIVILSLAFVAGAGLGSLDDVMTGAVLGFAPSAMLAVAQTFGWHPIPEIQPPSGLFYSSEIMGEYAALLAVWAVMSRRWWLAGFPLVALALSASRIGALTLAIAMLAYVPIPRYARVAGFVFLLLAIPLILFGPLKFAGGEHAVHRIILWGTALLAFTPLGNGLGWGTAAFPIEEFVHSDALQALAEVGIGALGLVLIPIMALAGKRGNRAERTLFIAICIEVFVSFPLHFPASGFVAAVVAGYLVGLGPAVRDVSYRGATADEPRRVRRRNAPIADDGGSGLLGPLVPLRSVLAWAPRLRAQVAGGHA